MSMEGEEHKTGRSLDMLPACRGICLRRLQSTLSLVYSEHGDPTRVVRLQEGELASAVAPRSVRVAWQAAPINPADINQIEGVYPVKPPLPAVGGNEGYGIVVGVGEGVSLLRQGDHVIPTVSGLGTWRSHGDHDEAALYPIDKRLPLEAAATIQVNPSTAYRMLKDFVDLKPGDTVVQNGATSGVGRAVMQICAIRGLKCVSVIRNRSEEALRKVKEELAGLGSTTVVTEEEMAGKMRGNVKASLALNCVGGRSSLFLAASLAKNGVMVTYGGMSKQPLSIPTAAFIFKDIRLAGFWMSRWYQQPRNNEEREEMYAEMTEWILRGELKSSPMEHVPLSNPSAVLAKATTDFSRKLLFVPSKNA